MTSLVDLLGCQEVLLLRMGRGVDVGGEVVGNRVLAVVEQRVVPDRRVPLLLGEDLAPVVLVLGEVELRCRPIAGLPALVQVAVGDLVGGRSNCSRTHGGHSTPDSVSIKGSFTPGPPAAESRVRPRGPR